MYRVDRNNFFKQAKNATVYTPEGVSQFIFNLINGKVSKSGKVVDPCVGAGSLLQPFEESGYSTLGIDIEDQGYPGTQVRNFIDVMPGEIDRPAMVIANPPFNIDDKTKEAVASRHGRRPLMPEVWLCKIIELWGRQVPIVLFAPYGMRLNQTGKSRRWSRFVSGEYPEIQSIIALPKDIYSDVLFHSEVLIFNIEGLRAHYFYDVENGGNSCTRG